MDLAHEYAIADTITDIPDWADYSLHVFGETSYFRSEVAAIEAQDRLSWHESQAACLLPTPRLRARRAAAELALVSTEKLAIRVANGDRTAVGEIARRSGKV